MVYICIDNETKQTLKTTTNMKTKNFNKVSEAVKFIEKLAESVATVMDCNYIGSDVKIYTQQIKNDYKDAIKWCGKYEREIYLRTRGAETSEKRIEEMGDKKIMTIKVEIFRGQSVISWGNKAA